MKKIALLTVAMGAIAMAAPAYAANYVINHSLNPALVGPNLFQENLATPVTAGVGDTVEFNLSFTGGQSITLQGDTFLWLLSLTNDGLGALDTDVTWEFFGASANLVSGPFSFSQVNQFVHLGSAPFSGMYRTDANPITFSGIRQTINITGTQLLDMDEDGIPETQSPNPRTYYSIALYTDGQRVTTVAVPEPATWAMMIMGFGLTGAALRRRQTRTGVGFA